MTTRNEQVLAALKELHGACVKVDELWDHSGTSMIDGYPTGMVSWDEFTAQVREWLRVQEELRKPIEPIAALELALEIIGTNLDRGKQDAVWIVVEQIEECFKKMCREGWAKQYRLFECVEWRPNDHPDCGWRLGTITNIKPEAIEVDHRFWVGPPLVRKKGENDAKTAD